MYLNEAGRMHAISGETITAAKFYRLAAEAALSKGKNQLYTSEIEGQAMMLLASLNDQGWVQTNSLARYLCSVEWIKSKISETEKSSCMGINMLKKA